MKTYPRLSVRPNSAGYYDAYLLKTAGHPEVWVSAGSTIHDALWWVPAPSVSRCCLAGA